MPVNVYGFWYISNHVDIRSLHFQFCPYFLTSVGGQFFCGVVYGIGCIVYSIILYACIVFSYCDISLYVFLCALYFYLFVCFFIHPIFFKRPFFSCFPLRDEFYCHYLSWYLLTVVFMVNILS